MQSSKDWPSLSITSLYGHPGRSLKPLPAAPYGEIPQGLLNRPLWLMPSTFNVTIAT